MHARKGLALPRASHSCEIALAGSVRLTSLAPAPFILLRLYSCRRFLIFVALFTAAFDIRMCEAVSDRVRRCLADGSVSCCSLKNHFNAHCTGRNMGEAGATLNDQPINQLTAEERASFDLRTACCSSTPGCTGTTSGPSGGGGTGTPGPNCDQNRRIPGLFYRA